jgi:hypothetical protein
VYLRIADYTCVFAVPFIFAKLYSLRFRGELFGTSYLREYFAELDGEI